MAIQSGTRLGRFEVRSLLGKGGVGEVYEAIDTKTQRSVVIKVLSTELSSTLSKRFAHELRIAASLSHPNICQIYDVAQTRGRLFVTMENVPGSNLQQFINGRPLDLRTALEIEIQVANALAAVHNHGIVHRDLKPTNVMVTYSGQVKVLDFGMPTSSELKEGWRNVTNAFKHHQLTTIYAAPEQVLTGMADPRSDIFSAGVVLYEMLAGEPPFHGATPEEAVSAVIEDTPPPISNFRGEPIPKNLKEVIDRALAKDPDYRYQRILDFRNDLETVLKEASAYQTSDRRPSNTGRVVNAWLVDAGLPLEVGATYDLGINIGLPREKSVGERPFSEPKWGNKTQLEILITLNSLDADITPERRTAILPKDAEMEPVFFQMIPRNIKGVRVGLSIYLAHDLTLLEKFHLQLATVMPVSATAK